MYDMLSTEIASKYVCHTTLTCLCKVNRIHLPEPGNTTWDKVVSQLGYCAQLLEEESKGSYIQIDR
jgi:hypothetical protein